MKLTPFFSKRKLRNGVIAHAFSKITKLKFRFSRTTRPLLRNTRFSAIRKYKMSLLTFCHFPPLWQLADNERRNSQQHGEDSPHRQTHRTDRKRRKRDVCPLFRFLLLPLPHEQGLNAAGDCHGQTRRQVFHERESTMRIYWTL